MLYIVSEWKRQSRLRLRIVCGQCRDQMHCRIHIKIVPAVRLGGLTPLANQGVNTHTHTHTTSITSSTASSGRLKKPSRFQEIVTGAEPVAMQSRLTVLLTSLQLIVVLTSDGGEIISDGAAKFTNSLNFVYPWKILYILTKHFQFYVCLTCCGKQPEWVEHNTSVDPRMGCSQITEDKPP